MTRDRAAGSGFYPPDALPTRVFHRLTELRIHDPDLPGRVLRQRDAVTERHRPVLVLAADHPARMVTQVGDDLLRMADRHEYLARIVRVLSAPSVGGVMATADVIEDLALLDHLAHATADGQRRLLDGKLLIGSVNRGGLAGYRHELYDPPTAYRNLTMAAEVGLDGVKLLARVPAADEFDRDAIEALTHVASSMDEAHRLGLDIFLEPLPVHRVEGRLEVDPGLGALLRAVAVASGLSSSSRRVWLRLPCHADFARVGQSCTQPVLLGAGPAHPDPLAMIDEISSTARTTPRVAGAVIGRSLLYPGDHDPASVAEALAAALTASPTADVALDRAATRLAEVPPPFIAFG